MGKIIISVLGVILQGRDNLNITENFKKLKRMEKQERKRPNNQKSARYYSAQA